MNILIILLGCNIASILLDRIETALAFSYIYRDDNVDWFLSGGIKDPFSETITEAQKMRNSIESNYHTTHKNINNQYWNYIYDTNSTNTAENMFMLKEYLYTNTRTYDDMYIITSQFHEPRVKKMVDIIHPYANFQWVLSPLQEEDSEYWENIHIPNVENDITKAQKKYSSI